MLPQQVAAEGPQMLQAQRVRPIFKAIVFKGLEFVSCQATVICRVLPQACATDLERSSTARASFSHDASIASMPVEVSVEVSDLCRRIITLWARKK